MKAEQPNLTSKKLAKVMRDFQTNQDQEKLL